MSAEIEARLVAFQAALQTMDDPKEVMRAGEAFLNAVETLSPQEQETYKDAIASLVAALETRILSLEQVLKQQQS